MRYTNTKRNKNKNKIYALIKRLENTSTEE